MTSVEGIEFLYDYKEERLPSLPISNVGWREFLWNSSLHTIFLQKMTSVEGIEFLYDYKEERLPSLSISNERWHFNVE